MLELRCDADLVAMREQRILSKGVAEIVEQYYFEWKEASSVEGDSLELEDGCITVIDPSRDDWRRILDIDQTVWIEYVERIDLNGTSVYRVGRMLGNDMMRTYFVQAGINQEVDEWLEEYKTL